MLDYVTKYFAVLSAGAIAGGSSLVVIFIYGYLGVFDWNLIWIIEYQDITKFTLIAIALGITVLPTLNAFTTVIYNLRLLDTRASWRYGMIAIIILIGFCVISISTAYHTQRSSLEYYYFLWLSIFLTIIMIAAMIRLWPDWITKTRFQQAQIVGGVLVFVFFLGKTLGLYVKEISSNRQDVITTAETLTDQKGCYFAVAPFHIL